MDKRVDPSQHPAKDTIIEFLRWFAGCIKQYRGEFGFCLDADSIQPYQELSAQPIKAEYKDLCHILNLSLDFPNSQQRGELSYESWLFNLLSKISEQLQRELAGLYEEDPDFLTWKIYLLSKTP